MASHPSQPGGSRAGPGKPRDPRGGCGRFLLWVALGALAYAGYQLFLAPGSDATSISYSSFREAVGSGDVVRIEVRDDRIRGTLRAPLKRVDSAGDTVDVTEFVTFLPSFGDPGLFGELRARDVEVETLPSGDAGFWRLLIFGLLPVLALGGFVFLYTRRMSGQAGSMFSLGRSGARLYERETDEATTFEDVAGAEGPKTELRELVRFLDDPGRFQALGAEVPRGVLLLGPPGTGKTLLARAVAGEAGVPFFSITGSDFMEMFVGVGAKRVRDLFEKAKAAAPSIVFIDEIDSIGRRRGTGIGGGHDEREQTLNQLLSELDGFEPAESVIVMAATNRPDILDPALLRPGRFDRRIDVPMPTRSERLAVLRLHARHKPLEPDVDLERVAGGTPGFSGADLENLLNEAALVAAREGLDAIGPEQLDEARDRILMGLEREGLAMTDDELEILAYHEGGHAVVAASLENTDPVHKVTVVPRGRSMGSTHQLPEEDRYIYRKEELLDRLAVTLGGRASEALVFDTATSGAGDDLERATDLARRMVLRWGMSDAVGPFASGGGDERVFLGEQMARRRDHSEETAREVDLEVRRILTEAQERATALLLEHREALDRVADRLREEEEITGEEVAEILRAT